MIVSVTRLHVSRLWHLPAFFRSSAACIAQAKAAPGFRAGSTFPGPGLTFWTATLWDNEEAMNQYVRTGAHLDAMKHLRRWCDEAATCHYEGSVMPKREDLRRELAPRAKFFGVNTPSTSHVARQIPERAPSREVPF